MTETVIAWLAIAISLVALWLNFLTIRNRRRQREHEQRSTRIAMGVGADDGLVYQSEPDGTVKAWRQT